MAGAWGVLVGTTQIAAGIGNGFYHTLLIYMNSSRRASGEFMTTELQC